MSHGAPQDFLALLHAEEDGSWEINSNVEEKDKNVTKQINSTQPQTALSLISHFNSPSPIKTQPIHPPLSSPFFAKDQGWVINQFPNPSNLNSTKKRGSDTDESPNEKKMKPKLNPVSLETKFSNNHSENMKEPKITDIASIDWTPSKRTYDITSKIFH
jgi:hypothetical protein